MLKRLHRAATARRDGVALEGDSGVALLMVIMLSLVVASLGLIVMSAVVQQVRPTILGQKNTRTIFAAEAGLQAALGQLRTGAAPPNGVGLVRGDPAALPCAMTGSVGSAGEGLTYTVRLQYFTTNPTGQTAAWRSSNQLACTSGGVSGVPSFALLSASGLSRSVAGYADAAGNRSLISLYTFNVDDTRAAGGLFFTVSGTYCLQAADAQDGARVSYVAAASCDRRNALQVFSWDTDYRIKLTSTTGTAGALCLTGVATSTESDGADALLRPCTASPSDPLSEEQLFSYEGGAHFRGQNAANTDYGAACLWAGSTGVTAGSVLRSGGTGSCSASDDDFGSWSPEPRVGAGAAGAKTTQIVNFEEFGRCADVTNGRVDWSYMIVYPCKQDPSGQGRLAWNHRWSYTEGLAGPQNISVLQNGTTRYCLQKPTSTASPAYVLFSTDCTSSASQFVRVGDTGSYGSSWTFTDTAGTRCLDTGPAQSPARSNVAWSTMVWAPCDGSASQKWNAPVDAADASLTGTRETVFGG